MFCSSLQRLSETFIILRKTERDTIKKMYIGLHIKRALFIPILIKLEFSRLIFEKYSNIKFHENPPSGSGVVPCGRTDGHNEANRRFHNFAKAPKHVSTLAVCFIV